MDPRGGGIPSTKLGYLFSLSSFETSLRSTFDTCTSFLVIYPCGFCLYDILIELFSIASWAC
ncbi:hypothetical protein BDW68DRAFT_68318 [Aspergillus falconensis]